MLNSSYVFFLIVSVLIYHLDISLRGLLNTQNQQQQQQQQQGGHMSGYNGPPPPNYNSSQQQQNLQSMRHHFLGGNTVPRQSQQQQQQQPPSSQQQQQQLPSMHNTFLDRGGGGGGVGGPNQQNSNNYQQRYQNYQRLQSHPGNMVPGGGGGVVGVGAVGGASQQQPSMRSIHQNNSGMGGVGGVGGASGVGYPGQQPTYAQTQLQAQQLALSIQAAAAAASGSGGGGVGGAKWHIPQAHQQQQQQQHQQLNNGLSGLTQHQLQYLNQSRQAAAAAVNENSFKISLKSPNTLKNSMQQNGGGVIGGGGGGIGLGAINLAGLNQSGQQHSVGNSTLNNNNNPSSIGSNSNIAMVVIPNVTSTNPKTPSPSTLNETTKDTDSIDKTCEESVNDLMATIAKLDSNGVQVLPEGRTKITSPHQVHSSTDIQTVINNNNKTLDSNDIDKNQQQKDDPNEDWCAVCMDGGELMCCDKCPKVFHQNCHIPSISALPDESETWQCLLCVNFSDLMHTNNEIVLGEKRTLTPLAGNEFKIIQRLVLELYCQYDHSLPFRELENRSNVAYYEIICK